MIIPLPPVSLAFSTASRNVNSFFSANTHSLPRQHLNAVTASRRPQPKPNLPKYNTTAAAVLRPLLIKTRIPPD